MDCTCAILSVCVLINLVLIVLVAFREERYIKEYHITDSEDDFELFSKHLERFRDSFSSLEVGAQRLNNEISNSKEDLHTVYLQLPNLQIDSSVELRGLEVHILEVNLKFDQLNRKFEEVKTVIDEIKSDFKGMEMSLLMLELKSYMDHQIERTERLKGELELNLGDSSIVKSNDYSEDRLGEIDEPIHFGLIIDEEFTHEELSSKSQSVDSEESNSNKPISDMKTFKLFRKQVNWTEALRMCEMDDLNLVSIRSPAEQQGIQDFLQKADHGSIDIWTSGNDLDQPGIFVWSVIGSLVTYSNWNPGVPNNTLQEQKHCMSLLNDFGYRWNVCDCSEQKYFVCEQQWSRD